MRRPIYWIVISLFLCLLLGYSSAQGGYGGIAAPGSQDYSGGLSTESQALESGSPVLEDGLSGVSVTAPGSSDDPGTMQGTNTDGVFGPGDAGGSARSPDSEMTGPAPEYQAGSSDGSRGPNDALTGGGSGNAGNAFNGGGFLDESGPFSSPGESPGVGNQIGSREGSSQGPGPRSGEDPALPDPGGQERSSSPGREEAGLIQNRARESSSHLQENGITGGPGGGREPETPGKGIAASYPSEGDNMLPGSMHGSLGLFAASAGGAGMARAGSEGPPAHSSPRPSPEAHGSHRQQQGMPVQYPCGPAQSTPVIPDHGPKGADTREDTASKSRSKRARLFFPEEGPVQPPVSAPSSSGIPLFPFSLLLFGGYKRISKRNVLEHDTRQNVFSAISGNPGIDVPMLVRSTGINENTLRYHLVKLVESGRITYLVKPGVIRYFLNQGSYSPAEQVLIHYLWSETPGAIIRLLRSTPGLTRQQISDALGITGPSVTRHMNHLIDDGIIQNRFPGRSNHYYLTEEVMRIFDPMISRIRAATGHGVSPLSFPARGGGRLPEPPAVY